MQGSEIGSPAVMERMIDQLVDHVGALKQRVDELAAENETLHEELAAKEQRIRELKQSLRQYKNPHTPPSRRGGAAPATDTDTADDDTAGESIWINYRARLSEYLIFSTLKK